MKVLMIAPRPFFVDKGFAIQVLEEAKSLQFLGNEVLVCCYSFGNNCEQVKTSRPFTIPFLKKSISKPSYSYILMDISLFFHSLITSIRFKPDIIHAHIHEGGLIGIIIGKILGIKVILDAHGSMIGEYKERKMLLNKYIEKIICTIETFVNRKVDAVMTWSKHRKSEILKDKKIPEDKIYLFDLGMDLDLFSIKGKNENLLKLLEIPEKKKIIGYLGLLTEYQGIEFLLEAFSLIRQKRDDTHLLIMGFQNLEYYKMKAERMGLISSITFTGRVPYIQAPNYLGICDVAVSPKISTQEINGKLINYMGMGLPVVVFETPINREILGELGIYAKYKDADDFAFKILSIIDSEEREALGKKLRNRAETRYSLKTLGRTITNIYSNILSEKEFLNLKQI